MWKSECGGLTELQGAGLTAGGNAGDKIAPVWTSRLVYYQHSDWGLGAMQVLYLSMLLPVLGFRV